jgi:diguanylate cyclase (GGDEF)-like protein
LSRDTTPDPDGDEQHNLVPCVDRALTERAALGRALAGRAEQVGDAVNEQLRGILGLGAADPLPELNASLTSTLATRIIARYLQSGRSATRDEEQVLARPGTLALHDTSMTTIVKLFLAWRDITVLTLRDLADELGTGPEVLRLAEEVTRASADASLVRMTKRFEERRMDLERMLEDERGRLVHEASHDQLTGLLNRRAFLEMVEQASEQLGPGEMVAIMFIDLDGFKAINDTHGHVVGDEFLKAFAGRLSTLLRPEDTAGRIGGDEFVVLCGRLRGGERAAKGIAHRVCTGLADSLEVAGATFCVSASIGVACASGPIDAPALLSRADSALYSAKRSGKGCVAVG